MKSRRWNHPRHLVGLPRQSSRQPCGADRLKRIEPFLTESHSIHRLARADCNPGKTRLNPASRGACNGSIESSRGTINLPIGSWSAELFSFLRNFQLVFFFSALFLNRPGCPGFVGIRFFSTFEIGVFVYFIALRSSNSDYNISRLSKMCAPALCHNTPDELMAAPYTSDFTKPKTNPDLVQYPLTGEELPLIMQGEIEPWLMESLNGYEGGYTKTTPQFLNPQPWDETGVPGEPWGQENMDMMRLVDRITSTFTKSVWISDSRQLL